MVGLVFPCLMAALVAVIAVMDFRTMRIPNGLNLALAAGGLAYQFLIGSEMVAAALSFAVFTYIALWGFRYAHLRLTGRIGLGLGDVKLAAASATWFSPWNLPVYLFVASSAALIYAIAKQLASSSDRHEERIPFGPFLGIALLCTWAMQTFEVFSLRPL